MSFNSYNYPWTNLHDINLDWLLSRVKDLAITQEDIEAVKEIYAVFGGYAFPTVKTYGAVGDGSTDDSQAYLDCLAAEDFVIFPAGEYYMPNPIASAVANKVIIGLPHAKIITDRGLHFNNCSNITVQGLDFLGGPQSFAYRKALQFYRCMDVLVADCSANDFWSVGFDFITSGRAEVRGCRIWDVQPNDGSATGAGVQFYYENGYDSTEYVTGYHRVIDCVIHDTGIDAILANTNNVTVQGCELYRCGLSAPAAGVYGNGRERLLIEDNTIHDCAGNGLDFVNSYHVTLANNLIRDINCAGVLLSGGGNITVSNCICNTCGLDASAFPNQDSGISIINNTTGLQIIGCSVSGNKAYGIRLHSQTGTVIAHVLYGPNDLGNIIATSNYQAASTTTVTPVP